MTGSLWFTWPLGDGMEQINCYAFVDLGVQIATCFDMARMKLSMWNASALKLKAGLQNLLSGRDNILLEASEGPANRLLGVMMEVVSAHDANADATLPDADVQKFNGAVFSLLSAFQLDFGRLPTFFVSPKGVYDTRRLINEAEAVFDQYRDELPRQTLDDTNHAGRCLAFDLPTAAGFHIARATESVIKQYMTAKGCLEIKESQRNWGAYIKALTEKNADGKIVQHLEQLKDLHRNPLTHPEESLTMMEAQSLWALCVSLINAMTVDMAPRQQVPVMPMLRPAL